MKVTVITRMMCSSCADIKEILDAYEIPYDVQYATETVGMSLLAMHFDGPDTLLPAIICECYRDMEYMGDLVDQLKIPCTIGVSKI